MKTIRKTAKNKFFAPIMSFILLFSTTFQANAAPLKIDVATEISGEQMFREIFFFQGGKMIESLPNSIQQEYAAVNNLTPAERSKRNEVIDNVIALIKSNNPNYFTTLKDAIKSKNPYEVQENLRKGGNLIISSLSFQNDFRQLSEYLGDRKIDLSNRDEVKNLVTEMKAQNVKMQTADEFACIAFAFALVLAVAIVGVAVIVSVIVEVINYAQAFSQKGSSLKSDRYITSIITIYS